MLAGAELLVGIYLICYGCWKASQVDDNLKKLAAALQPSDRKHASDKTS